jgi:hypothetical protein
MASNFTETEVIKLLYADIEKVLFRPKVTKMSSFEQKVKNHSRDFKTKINDERQHFDVVNALAEEPNSYHQVREHFKILLHKTKPKLLPDPKIKHKTIFT